MRCTLFSSIIFLLTALSIHGQNTPNPDYSLLWEISGGDLNGKSYVFGSAHVNDNRAFDFPDSLVWAIKSCEAFATEVNMDSIDYQIRDILKKEILEADEEDNNKDKSAETIFDPNGKETLLDMYLYRVAKVLDKKTFGLENYDAPIELLDIMGSKNKKDKTMNFGSEEYNKFIDVYASGDIYKMEKAFIDDDITEGYDMINRNIVQANSILNLGRIQSTFSVIGAGHLFGDQNVLFLLREKGFTVRKVRYTKTQQSNIESIYKSSLINKWSKSIGFSGGYITSSPNSTKSYLLNQMIDVNFDTELSLGLVYLTMAFRPPNGPSKSQIKAFIDAYIKDPNSITYCDSTITNSTQSYEYVFKGDFFTSMKASIQNDLLVFQAVLGLSQSSLDHENVQKYFAGFETSEPSQKWTIQNSEDGSFKYFFQENVPWQENLVAHPDFPDRGELKINYKATYDKNKGDTYLLRYHSHLPGIVYPNESNDLKVTAENFAQIYKGDLTSYTPRMFGQYHSADLEIKNKAGSVYYIRMIIRGINLYVLLQESKSSAKNEEFFSAFEFTDFKLKDLTPFEYGDENISMSLPPTRYYFESIDDGDTVDNYAFSDIATGSSIDIEITNYNKYSEHIISDSTLSIEARGLDKEDSNVLSFTHFNHCNSCKGWRFSYKTDSTKMIRTDIEILVNRTSLHFLFLTPIEVDYDKYIDSILSTLYIKEDPEFEDFFSKRRVDYILKNLHSSDSTVHAEALDAFIEYEKFVEDDIPMLLSLLDDEFIDSDEEYNTYYYVITNLHEFGGSDIEDKLRSFYKSGISEVTKNRILESFANRSEETTIEGLLELLGAGEPLDFYSDNLYQDFADSLDLYKANYETLKSLADDEVAPGQFMALSVDWHLYDPALSYIQEDLDWYETEVEEHIVDYKETVEAGETFRPAEYIMDYFELQENSPQKSQFYNLLINNDSNFGHYRMIYNQIVSNEAVDKQLLENLVKRDSYYLYWIIKAAQSNERDDILSKEQLELKNFSAAIMTKYFYDSYSIELSSCQILKTLEVPAVLDKEGSLLFLECVTADAEDGKFYGLVGTFAVDHSFDFDDDISVYYNSAQTAEDPLTLIPSMLDYIKSNVNE